jgi:sulfide:quinone oxidoreductase
MPRRVLILGAGFGGLELSTRLSEELADEVQVTTSTRTTPSFSGSRSSM